MPTTAPTNVNGTEAVNSQPDLPASSAQASVPPIAVREKPMGPKQRSATGTALVLTMVLLMAQLIAIWAAVTSATSTADPKPPIPRSALLFGLAHDTFTPDVVLIVMVLLVGALGALVGATRRFLHYAGRDELTRRDQTAPVNPYGVAALSALVGLFTRHAVSKLTDIFDTMFGRPREDAHPVTVEKDPG